MTLTMSMVLVWLMKGVVTMQGMEVTPTLRVYDTQQHCEQAKHLLTPLVPFGLRCESDRVLTDPLEK